MWSCSRQTTLPSPAGVYSLVMLTKNVLSEGSDVLRTSLGLALHLSQGSQVCFGASLSKQEWKTDHPVNIPKTHPQPLSKDAASAKVVRSTRTSVIIVLEANLLSKAHDKFECVCI